MVLLDLFQNVSRKNNHLKTATGKGTFELRYGTAATTGTMEKR
jgi:hypothetical protein